MDNIGYISVSRQNALKRELDSIAHNIANISTNGFRREGALFAEQVEGLENAEDEISFATLGKRYIDLTPGELKTSGNPFDVSIDGEGFFLIEAGEGQGLTRNGGFALNGANQLVTMTGARVLDESGGPITIPAETEEIQIAIDGAIFADGNAIGKLAIVDTDPNQLQRVGDNTFVTAAEITPHRSATVRQYTIEGSNVNAVMELARMIEVQRTYELSKSVTDTEDDRIEQTIRTLGGN